MKEPEGSHPVRGRKRAAPARGRGKGRGKGSTMPTKRAKKTDKPSMQSMLMDVDDDEDSEDDMQARLQKSQPKVRQSSLFLDFIEGKICKSRLVKISEPGGIQVLR